jgi:hypothetical protein
MGCRLVASDASQRDLLPLMSDVSLNEMYLEPDTCMGSVWHSSTTIPMLAFEQGRFGGISWLAETDIYENIDAFSILLRRHLRATLESLTFNVALRLQGSSGKSSRDQEQETSLPTAISNGGLEIDHDSEIETTLTISPQERLTVDS